MSVKSIIKAFPTFFSLHADFKQEDHQYIIDELSFDSLAAIWIKLLKTYEKSLSPGKSWGKLPGKNQVWLYGNGDPELVTRTLFSLGPWLSSPSQSKQLITRKTNLDLNDLFIQAIIHGTDPMNNEYWKSQVTIKRKGLFRKKYEQLSQQYCVEASTVAWALWLTRDQLTSNFNNKQLENIQNWLDLFGVNYSNRKNNWNLFFLINHSVRKKLGWSYDESVIQTSLKMVEACYEGEGWYSDTPGDSQFDNYAHWVFSAYLMYWVIIDGDSQPAIKEKVLSRVRELTQADPYWYGKDGEHPEYGRSSIYKFTRLVSMILAYKLGICPLSPGVLKRLVRKHINFYIKNGSLDMHHGIVRQVLSRTGSTDICESYNAPGSPYWVMMTFGALWMLDEDDQIWQIPEQPLPVESHDFIKQIPTTGWTLIGDKNTGQVVLINPSVDHHKGWQDVNGTYPSKYRKFSYHSGLGYLVGTKDFTPCDNMLSLSIDEKNWQYPIFTGHKLDKENPHIIKSQQKQIIMDPASDNALKVNIHTVILLHNDIQIRIHRVEPEDNDSEYMIHEGGYAIGYEKDETVQTIENKNWIYAKTPHGATFFANILGYNQQFCNNHLYHYKDKHTRHARFIFPYAGFSDKVKGIQEVAVFVKGCSEPFEPGMCFDELVSLNLQDNNVSILFRDGTTINTSIYL